ncbi:nucleotidyltransferase family protein [Lysinibacillus fusiformis]
MRLLQTEKDLINLIAADDWMMNVLEAVEKVHLPDCWVCAGFIRSKVWDYIYEKEDRTPVADIDVIYYDSSNLTEEKEKHYEQELLKICKDEPWSVKNQARMHVINGSNPYHSSLDGISHFPEIATAIGIKLTNGRLQVAAPYGIHQLSAGIIEPTPFFLENKERYVIYRQRITSKQWHLRWPKLEINLQ